MLTFVTLMIVVASRKRPYLGVGWFWYIGAYLTGLRVAPDMTLANGSLGLILKKTGRLAEARRHLVVAARAMPESVEYEEALAEVLRMLERSEADLR